MQASTAEVEHAQQYQEAEDRLILSLGQLDGLITKLREQGYQVFGPRARDGCIMIGPITGVSDLPAGVSDAQAPGNYRLAKRVDGALFAYTVSLHTWRHFLQPQRQLLLRARRTGGSLTILPERAVAIRQAFFGVRPCDLAALAIHDHILSADQFVDPHYVARRRDSFVVAVNCGRPGGTCFCASMGTGPHARSGFDVALTEILDSRGHRFLAEAGTDNGARFLAELEGSPAGEEDICAASEIWKRSRESMARTLDADGIAELLARSRLSPRWEEIAKRCLSCGSCTLVCPTCYCTTVVDKQELTGDSAARWRRWDACFAVRHSYIHGGPVRQSLAARYRQWLTHKLSGWKEQYGMLGCVGCGRCITWCPARIDITVEVAAIRQDEARSKQEAP